MLLLSGSVGWLRTAAVAAGDDAPSTVATVAAGVVLVLTILLLMFAALQLFSMVCARRGGWRRLAAVHRARGSRPEGFERLLVRASIGGVIYKNGVRATCCTEGLYLRTTALDRLAHAPLLISWSAVREARAEDLGRYLAQALSGGPAAAALLVRLELKKIVRGIERHPELKNVILTVEAGGERVELQLVIDARDLRDHLPALR